MACISYFAILFRLQTEMGLNFKALTVASTSKSRTQFPVPQCWESTRSTPLQYPAQPETKKQSNTIYTHSNLKIISLTTKKGPIHENSKPISQITSLRALRRSFSSMTWRSKASRASASLSSRLLNSIRAKWPVCGGPKTPSGSFLRLIQTNIKFEKKKRKKNWL